jgi:hypothetical protein
VVIRTSGRKAGFINCENKEALTNQTTLQIDPLSRLVGALVSITPITNDQGEVFIFTVWTSTSVFLQRLIALTSFNFDSSFSYRNKGTLPHVLRPLQ